jgi:hypothetical protein
VLFLAVLRREWRRDDRGIGDGPSGEAQVIAGELMVHRIQNLASKFMLLQQAMKAQDRRLIGRSGTA